MANIYQQIDNNKRNSTVVMIGFVIFIVGVSYIFSQTLDFGIGVVGIALIISGFISFFGYYFSDRIILKLAHAKPANRQEHFHFYTVAENLSMAAQIPMPKLYVIEDNSPNAFATGRDPHHAVVAATTGLLNLLDRSELEGVVAHELSHIRNYDIRLMSIVAVLVGMIALLSDIFLRLSWHRSSGRSSGNKGGQLQAIFMIIALVLALLSPLIANLIKLAINRRREFLADSSAAFLTRYPEGLARALAKISADPSPLSVANKATAHLFIISPLNKPQATVGWFSNLFNTHPPVQARIDALRGNLTQSL